MWSGGKDSYLALARSKREGRHVSLLVNFYDERSGRVRFHGTRQSLIESQAAALGIALLQRATTPETYEPMLRAALLELRSRGIDGVVFGNIHLADVREWFESRVHQAGLTHHEPLWQESPSALLDEFVASGAEALITCVELASLPAAWLGRSIDEAFATDIARHPAVDPCGERGEYHSFVYAGPLFLHHVPWRPGPLHEATGFAQLELLAR